MPADGDPATRRPVDGDDLVLRVVRLVRENQKLRRVVAIQALDRAALQAALRRVREAAQGADGRQV